MKEPDIISVTMRLGKADLIAACLAFASVVETKLISQETITVRDSEFTVDTPLTSVGDLVGVVTSHLRDLFMGTPSGEIESKIECWIVENLFDNEPNDHARDAARVAINLLSAMKHEITSAGFTHDGDDGYYELLRCNSSGSLILSYNRCSG